MKKNADSNVKHKYNTNIMKIKLINKKIKKKNYNCFNFDRVRTCLLFLVFDERVCGDLH